MSAKPIPASELRHLRYHGGEQAEQDVVDAYTAGREDERAAIVAYLRERAAAFSASPDVELSVYASSDFEMAAVHIEQGAHLGKEGGE